ncbi:DUF4854 domain-containing protein [Clostridiales Family XIII bacterium BX16]|uniref:DUF4854 domain-containing protein n=1 Tax=Lentihominibacter faecis TaxID=2764712 RepID=A0A923SKX8_9FIRM|nr:DUF4854 domain-containing protein [Lentihominibacter faecis]MBC5998689.1 DUF4854 domain-containing protein [Lentihominibacter faecis]
MKKVITLVAAIMLLVTSTLALAGCGGTKTLEEYVNSDSDVQQELSDLESSLGTGGSISVKENNIKLIYKYDQTFDEATATAMKPQLEQAMNSMESQFQGMIDDLKEDSGIDDVSMTIVYQDANGTELYSNTYQ